jgi:archaeal flagellin FlaB
MIQPKKANIGLIGISAIILLVLLASSRQARFTKGTVGIGTLIIFIAMILVAAIAAAVLISTGGSMQQKALITGNEAREGISYGLEAVSVKGSDASQAGTPHSVNRLTIMARLPAGSGTLSLNSTILTLDTTMASQTFTYGGTVADSVNAASTNDYVVSYLQSGPYHEDGYVNLGDTVKIKFNIAGSLRENMKAKVSIISRAGSPNTLELVTPDSMTEQVVVLWPMN